MSTAAAPSLTDKIFSYAPLDKLDKGELVSRYDISADLVGIATSIQAQTGQVPQTTNVISSIPAGGILINTAGAYRFASDLSWSPAAVACSAITIAVSNVVLDLGGFSLLATVPDSSQFIVGISVQSGSDNVTIRNGTLANMGYQGICAKEVSGLTIADLTVDGLVFTATTQQPQTTTPSGICVLKAAGVTVTNCTVQNLNVTAPSCAGIQLAKIIGATVSGCAVSNLVNHDGSAQGYSYLLAAGVTTSSCTAATFQSHYQGILETMGHTVIGFLPTFCVGLRFDSCSSTNMVGCCDDCHGMSVFLCALVSVSDFSANNITDGVSASNSGAKATGLEVYGALVSVFNSTATNITAIQPQDKQGTGFSAWGGAIAFIGCQASNVSVVNATGQQDPSLGYGTGFGWAPDPRPEFIFGAYNIEYFACTATNCQVGFDTWFHVNSNWSLVSYSGCGTNILVQPDTATRTLSGNACSECNPPITVTITNIASGNTYPST